VAPKNVRDAADALSHGLTTALPSSGDRVPYVVDPELFVGVAPFMDQDDPRRIVAFDPNRIAVLIGVNPQA
jgi:hypothetical protein